MLYRAVTIIALTILAVVGTFACSRPARDDNVPTVAPTALLPSTFPSAAATREIAPSPMVRLTSTPLPSPTPRPTPCQHSVLPSLGEVWDEQELGCPITPGAAAVSTAYAPFAGGQMLWRGDTDLVYVLYNNGKWESYPNEWQTGDPEYTCGEASSPSTPIRGFGRVWCDHPDVREVLGAATAAEIGDSASAVQDFVNGTILIAPFGAAFVFVGEDGVWRLVEE